MPTQEEILNQRISQIEQNVQNLQDNFFKNNFAGSQRLIKSTTIKLGDLFSRVRATGLTVLNIKSYTNFESSTRFTPTVGGSGANTYDANGLLVSPGATGTSFAQVKWFTVQGIFKGSPTFSVVLSAANISNDNTGTDDRQRVTDIYNIHTALVAYKVANGNYPTALSALVPTQLASIPTDPLTGGAYKYAYKTDQTDAHIGATLQTSTASSLSTDEDFNSNIAGWTNGFNGTDTSLILDFRMESATDPSLPATPSGSGSAFFGIGNPTVTGSGHIFTTADRSFAGFYLQRTGGVITLYAVQSDGSGSRTISEALTTVYDTDTLDLILKVNGTVSIDYYWRKNVLTLSAKTTLSTTVPSTISGTGGNNCQLSASNDATAFNFSWYAVSASYER